MLMAVWVAFANAATVQEYGPIRCLKTLGKGDTLTVWKLDRLDRSLRDLIGLLDDLKARGVAFRSLTEALDTTTPTGPARGVKMGRKPLLSPQQVVHARTLLEQGEHPDTVAQSLNVSRRTLYRTLQG